MVSTKVGFIYMCFLLQYKSANGILTFCKNNMFGKNLFLELWSKNLLTNQNVALFKLQYLTNKLNFSLWLDIHERNKY